MSAIFIIFILFFYISTKFAINIEIIYKYSKCLKCIYKHYYIWFYIFIQTYYKYNKCISYCYKKKTSYKCLFVQQQKRKIGIKMDRRTEGQTGVTQSCQWTADNEIISLTSDFILCQLWRFFFYSISYPITNFYLKFSFIATIFVFFLFNFIY